MKLGEFIDEYYIPSLAGLRESTISGYRSSIELHVRPTFGDWEMEDIRARDIQSWLASFDRDGAAHKAYKTLRQIIRRAIDYDMFEVVDPTTKHIRVPRCPRKDPKILEAGEVRRLIRGFRGHYLEATVICAVMLGLRRGEAFGLEWEDIDLEAGMVRISRSYQKINGRIYVYPPKTPKSRRTCYLPKHVMGRMRTLGRGRSGRICPEESPDVMAREYKRLCLEKNLPYTPFTNLRHTWATMAVEGGADITTVANMLGHTDIMTAYNHYVRPREQAYIRAQGLVDKMVFGA